MKYCLPLLSLVVFLCSCNHEAPNPIEDADKEISSMVAQTEVVETFTELPDQIDYDTHIITYEYLEGSEDSSRNCSLKTKDGIRVSREGSCYYQLPFDNEYVTDHLLEMGEEQAIYESFDPLMCEAGGNSAYDRYVFDKDSKGRVEKVRHYMAWYEGVTEDGEDITYDIPDYFLGHTVEIKYTESSRTMYTYYEDGELISIMTNIYDEKERLSIQIWNMIGDKTFKAFYYY